MPTKTISRIRSIFQINYDLYNSLKDSEGVFASILREDVVGGRLSLTSVGLQSRDKSSLEDAVESYLFLVPTQKVVLYKTKER